jgi:3-hydroxybutyryl-CoA dehydrogenase
MRVAVIGAGTMGHGIAQVAAVAGHEVTLFDISPPVVEAALERIQENLDKAIALGKLSAGDVNLALRRIRTTHDLASIAGCHMVIEAAPEDLKMKRSIFRAAEETLTPTAILATNTSSISIEALAQGLRRPNRFIGLHFFNPPYVLSLVEIVFGPETEENTIDEALAFVKGLGKEPVVVKDSPGFATSRLGVALGLEAMRMLEEGVADAESIDRAMELGYRHPMGPLRLTDLVGLDVRLGIAEYLFETLGQPHFAPPDILRRLVAEGKLGKKSGEGFYRWE